MSASSLKRASRVLFVFLYIVATIAVAHDRSVHVADRFHSASSSTPSVRPPCGHIVEALPQFSHAKKPRPYLVGVLPKAIESIECMVQREIVPQPRVEYWLQLSVETSTTRAPPELT